MNPITFEMELVPIYNKIEIIQNKPFPILSMDEFSEYETLFNYIYCGIIYNFLLKVENKELLSYEEYISLSEQFISSRIFNGERTVSYGKTPILTVSRYNEETGSVITPIYGNNINKLNRVTNI